MIKKLLTFLCTWLALPIAFAITYDKADNYGSVVGYDFTVTAQHKDTLRVIAREYDMGFSPIANANPELSQTDYLLPGTKVYIPAKVILPPGPREGIVVNLAEYRLYFYPPQSDKIFVFPVGIGKIGWGTPLFSAHVTKKAAYPSWYVPQSVIDYNADKGIELPRIMPASIRNPLGQYAIYLSKRGYLIHGTTRPLGVGGRVSSGCMRLYPEDIEALYHLIYAKAPVRVTDHPYKVGQLNNELYMEADPIEMDTESLYAHSPAGLLSQLLGLTSGKIEKINLKKVDKITNNATGIAYRIDNLELNN